MWYRAWVCAAALVWWAAIAQLPPPAVCQPAPGPAGRSGAVSEEVVRDASSLQAALLGGTTRIQIAANLEASDVPPVPQPTPRDYIFPVTQATEWLVGACAPASTVCPTCTGSSACTISASSQSSLFGVVDPGSRLWIHNLEIRFHREPGENSTIVVDALLQVDVWATAVRVTLVNSGGVNTQPPFVQAVGGNVSVDGGRGGFDDYEVYADFVWDPKDDRFPAMLFVHTGPHSRVYVQGSHITCTQPADVRTYGDTPVMVTFVTGSGTVTFASSSFFLNQDQYEPLFVLESCKSDRVRFLDCTFECAARIRVYAYSEVMRVTRPQQVVVCPSAAPLESGDFVDPLTKFSLLHWVDLRELSDPAVDRSRQAVCSADGEAFLNGAEVELQEWLKATGVRIRNVLPQSSACVSVSPICFSTPGYGYGASDFDVELQRTPGRHSQATEMVGIVGFAVFLIAMCGLPYCLMAASARQRRGEGVNPGPVGTTSFLPGWRDGDSGDEEESAHVFTPPLDDAGCSCKRLAPGDDACLLCPLCNHALSHTCRKGSPDRRPKVLPCGHSICARCSQTMEQNLAYSSMEGAQPGKLQLPVNYSATEALTPAVTSGRHGPPGPPSSRNGSVRLPTSARSCMAHAASMHALPKERGDDDASDAASVGGGKAATAKPDARSDAPPTASFFGWLETLRRSANSLISFPSSERLQAGPQWIPDQEAFTCTICYELQSPSAPESGNVDRRPVVFPCGHGACADCASRIRHRGCCYERCEWSPADKAKPFCINHLVVWLMQLAESCNYTPVSVPCKNGTCCAQHAVADDRHADGANRV